MLLKATEKGQELLNNLRETHITQMSQVLSYMTGDELVLQLRVLKDLKKAAETHLQKTTQ
jgi:DNA-binding MarR family transcriptional regulator